MFSRVSCVNKSLDALRNLPGRSRNLMSSKIYIQHRNLSSKPFELSSLNRPNRGIIKNTLSSNGSDGNPTVMSTNLKGLLKKGDSPFDQFERHRDILKTPQTPLVTELKNQIHLRGPMSISEWMQFCLGHPEHGYYMQRDAIGKTGDFITNPEISSIFSELIGIWCVTAWMKLGRPSKLQIIECGPGRGTLMKDLLMATSHFPDFFNSISVHFVENSGIMRELQRQALNVTLDESVHDKTNTHEWAREKQTLDTIDELKKAHAEALVQMDKMKVKMESGVIEKIGLTDVNGLPLISSNEMTDIEDTKAQVKRIQGVIDDITKKIQMHLSDKMANVASGIASPEECASIHNYHHDDLDPRALMTRPAVFGTAPSPQSLSEKEQGEKKTDDPEFPNPIFKERDAFGGRTKTNTTFPVHWHWSVGEIPCDAPCLVIGHEFFDALPVHQFQYTERGWREILVDIDDSTGPHHFKYVLSPEPTPASTAFATPLHIYGAAQVDKLVADSRTTPSDFTPSDSTSPSTTHSTTHSAVDSADSESVHGVRSKVLERVMANQKKLIEEHRRHLEEINSNVVQSQSESIVFNTNLNLTNPGLSSVSTNTSNEDIFSLLGDDPSSPSPSDNLDSNTSPNLILDLNNKNIFKKDQLPQSSPTSDSQFPDKAPTPSNTVVSDEMLHFDEFPEIETPTGDMFRFDKEDVSFSDPSGHRSVPSLNQFFEVTNSDEVKTTLRTPHRIGDTYEVSPASMIWMEQIILRLMKTRGGCLFVDYGDNDSGFDLTLQNNSLDDSKLNAFAMNINSRVFRELSVQGIKSHGHADVLQEPGLVDLSAHVNFGALGAIAKRTVKQIQLLLKEPIDSAEYLKAMEMLQISHNIDPHLLKSKPASAPSKRYPLGSEPTKEPKTISNTSFGFDMESDVTLHGVDVYPAITQSAFLQQLGIEQRFSDLLRMCRTDEEKQHLFGAVNRLVDPSQMGELFKVMSIISDDATSPVGWDKSHDDVL